MPEVIPRERLVAYLDEYLEAQRGRDYGPNGLQVEGREDVTLLVTGVSACQRLFERAAELGADAILVHHGIFWEGDDRSLTGLRYRRVAALVQSEINLLAYHLPLDRHPVVGNNALAVRRFGITDPRPFGEHEGVSIGFGGALSPPLAPEAFSHRCLEVFGQEPLAFPYGPDPIRSAAFVSGGAQALFHTAIAEEYDAYVTGEATEWVMNVAREAATHYFAAGHYATERLGVQALGAHLADHFDLEVEFVDVPNPV
jgi:dinuclear metal center YbgI/SA1388 family protein